MVRLLIALMLNFLCSNTLKSSEEQLVPIYVFEIKPLIYFDGLSENKIKGSWFNSFEELAKTSGLKFNYQFTSIPRLEKFLDSNAPGCSLTLLKTPKRMKINGIQFIHDHPIKTIIKSYQRSEDKRELTLEDFKKNSHLRIVSNTSVGTDILRTQGVQAELLFNINSITNMLLMKRVDVFVGSNLAIEKLIEFQEKKIKPGIIIKTLTHGIACSRGTSLDITSRLKRGANAWLLPE